MTELLSHPDKLLIDHLREVATIATATVADKGYRFALSGSAEVTPKRIHPTKGILLE